MRLILSQHCQPILEPGTPQNSNVIVIGGSGTGKTTSVLEPNLELCQSSFLISDPKGVLYDKYWSYLEERGYDVRRLNFFDPLDPESNSYNPFHYVRNEDDIVKMAHLLVRASDNGMKTYGGDPFWLDAAELLLCALLGYVWEGDRTKRQMSTVIDLIRKSQIDEDYSGSTTDLDRLFQALPPCFGKRCYEGFRLAAGRTLKSILITLYSILFKYDSEELHGLLQTDTMHLEQIAFKRTAVFITVSDHDRSMDPLANLFFSQALSILMGIADHRPDHCLAVPVQFMLDDFGTNVVIADFPRMISSFRSRGISTILLMQSEAQLEQFYGRDASTIIANCDSYVYTGGNDLNAMRAMSLRCGVPLRQMQELQMGSCIVCRRGQVPIFDDLFNLDRVFLGDDFERSEEGAV